MSFYQALSQYYDEIFAVDEAEMSFIKSLMKGRKRLLDLGCGTGNKTVLLSAPDNHLVGVDLDQAMIERARARHARPNIDYERLDMLEAARRFTGSSFDGLLCLGNTLVHIASYPLMERFLADLAFLLTPSGLAVIQILNYDCLKAHKVRELPLIETEHTVFQRFYDWTAEGSLNFRTVLKIKASGRKQSHETSLRPVGRVQLEGMLRQAGFRRLENYGNYQGGPYQDDSFILITAAAKNRPAYPPS